MSCALCARYAQRELGLGELHHPQAATHGWYACAVFTIPTVGIKPYRLALEPAMTFKGPTTGERETKTMVDLSEVVPTECPPYTWYEESAGEVVLRLQFRALSGLGDGGGVKHEAVQHCGGVVWSV